ncbi:MAG: GxxExxY protein [Bacteroidaceae bacterium]|nr:GxxExxY protein [Bacteroidaceae bacterium]
MDRLNSISEKIIGAAIAVHKELGSGLLEAVYEACLLKEMEQRGIEVSHQVDLPLYYKGQPTGKNFRIDILVENEVVVELKSVEELSPIHEAQLLTYLKLTQKKLGLLINFNVPLLKQGIVRRVL